MTLTTGGMLTRRTGLAGNISGHKITGVALCNQVRSMDIVARIALKKAKYIGTLDEAAIDEIAGRVISMIDPA